MSKTAATKAMGLYLHGCDGDFNTSPNWFERSGFKVFAPVITAALLSNMPPTGRLSFLQDVGMAASTRSTIQDIPHAADP